MTKSTDYIASLAKGLRVIECFGADTARLSITEVAQQCGLDRSSARRCLLTLEAEGYMAYDGKFFSLKPRALRLGLGALNALPLPKIVQPWLDQLTEKIDESCSVSILDETEIVYIARAAQKRVMSIGLMPGSRLPAHCTSMGRVLLAALPEEEAMAIISRSVLAPRTVNSLSHPNDIISEIAAVRQQGYAVNDQEIEVGLRSIAVPLLNARGDVVAALNTGVSAGRAETSELVDRFLPFLQRVQEGLRGSLI